MLCPLRDQRTSEVQKMSGLAIVMEDVDPRNSANVESAIRKRLGEPPEDENWTLTITGSPSGLSYYRAVINTPRHSRQLFIFESDDLAGEICDWLKLYPL